MSRRHVVGISMSAALTAAALALGLAVRPMAAQQAPVRVPASVLERYVGEYSNSTGGTIVIRLRGDTLFEEVGPQQRILVPMSETLFWFAGVVTFEFVPDQAGGMTMLQSDGAEIEQRLRRKGSPPPPPEAGRAAVRVPRSVLERYVGTYQFIP